MTLIISNERLRSICECNKWFTYGNEEQYEKLFELKNNLADINILILLIWICSEKKFEIREIENKIKKYNAE